MGNNHSTHTKDTHGATDLSRDGISHLKTQNTPNVKPRRHTHLLAVNVSDLLSTDDDEDDSMMITFRAS